MDTSEIFKAYDVRGTYPDQLDERLAEAVGSAFATFVDGPEIVMARDMRASGVTLSEAFARGEYHVDDHLFHPAHRRRH